MPTLTLDADLEPLIPGYLERRHDDIAELQAAISGSNFAVIQSIGHNLKGSGAGYGFDEITELGGTLEQAGIERDVATAAAMTGRLEEYLRLLDIRYEAM